MATLINLFIHTHECHSLARNYFREFVTSLTAAAAQYGTATILLEVR